MGDMGNIGAEGPMGDVGWGRRWRRMGKMGREFSVDGFGRRCGGTKSSQKHKNGEYLYQKNSVNGFGLRVPAKLQ